MYTVGRSYLSPYIKKQEQGEPVYQEIGEIKKIRKQKAGEEEPSWAPKPSLVYGVFTEKQVAKYVPPDQVVVRPELL